MRLIDSHAHLTSEQLAGEAAAVVARARAAGVEAVVSIGTDVEDSRAAASLAAELSGVYATAGIHPHAAADAAADAMAEIRELARGPRVVALGETGLDYYYDNSPREAQRELFARHLELGRELDLPVVVHAREADDDVSALLREAGQGTRGVLHCFAGGRPLLETALEIGWYVSFSGLVTFKKYADVELLRAVPGDRLLVETDSPYLAPVPHRGKRNEPAHVVFTARHIAELRGEDPQVLAAATVRNTRAFYRIEEPGA
jgi:TatD DNase family protein